MNIERINLYTFKIDDSVKGMDVLHGNIMKVRVSIIASKAINAAGNVESVISIICGIVDLGVNTPKVSEIVAHLQLRIKDYLLHSGEHDSLKPIKFNCNPRHPHKNLFEFIDNNMRAPEAYQTMRVFDCSNNMLVQRRLEKELLKKYSKVKHGRS